MTVQTLRKLAVALHCSSDDIVFGPSEVESGNCRRASSHLLELHTSTGKPSCRYHGSGFQSSSSPAGCRTFVKVTLPQSRPVSLSLLSIDRLLGLCDFKTKTDAPEGSIGFLLTFCNIYEPLSTFSSKCGNGLFFLPFYQANTAQFTPPGSSGASRRNFPRCFPKMLADSPRIACTFWFISQKFSDALHQLESYGIAPQVEDIGHYVLYCTCQF